MKMTAVNSVYLIKNIQYLVFYKLVIDNSEMTTVNLAEKNLPVTSLFENIPRLDVKGNYMIYGH